MALLATRTVWSSKGPGIELAYQSAVGKCCVFVKASFFEAQDRAFESQVMKSLTARVGGAKISTPALDDTTAPRGWWVPICDKGGSCTVRLRPLPGARCLGLDSPGLLPPILRMQFFGLILNTPFASLSLASTTTDSPKCCPRWLGWPPGFRIHPGSRKSSESIRLGKSGHPTSTHSPPASSSVWRRSTNDA